MTITETIDELQGLLDSLRVDIVLGYQPTARDLEWITDARRVLRGLVVFTSQGWGADVFDLQLLGRCEWLDRCLAQKESRL